MLFVPAVAASCSGSDPSASATAREGDGAEDVVLPADQVDDPDCGEATIGDDGGSLVAALAVVEGAVQGLCAGDPDQRLDAAWAELVDIVRIEQLWTEEQLASIPEPSEWSRDLGSRGRSSTEIPDVSADELMCDVGAPRRGTLTPFDGTSAPCTGEHVIATTAA